LKSFLFKLKAHPLNGLAGKEGVDRLTVTAQSGRSAKIFEKIAFFRLQASYKLQAGL
jgi:hypothetical protein